MQMVAAPLTNVHTRQSHTEKVPNTCTGLDQLLIIHHTASGAMPEYRLAASEQ